MFLLQKEVRALKQTYHAEVALIFKAGSFGLIKSN